MNSDDVDVSIFTVNVLLEYAIKSICMFFRERAHFGMAGHI